MKFHKPKFWDKKSLSFWSLLLFPFSFIYFILLNINKIKKAKKFDIPVFCVGNIYLGGTGKTPLSKEIFEIGKLIGKKPAFVKKYYDYLKDEVYLLEEKGKTFVNKKRKESIEQLIKNNYDMAILDDGYQDYSIKKTFSVLCFNQNQWLGNGFILPSGPLREGLSSIKRANCIIINGNKDENIEKKINKIKNLKIFYSNYKPKNINKFRDKRIFAFAGIGNPLNFFELLKKNNLEIIKYKSFPDHYNYKINDLEKLKSISNELNAILLTTEKDYFRINEKFRQNIEKFDISLEIENKNEFVKLVKSYI